MSYFVFELEFNSPKDYIANTIKSYANAQGVEIDVFWKNQSICLYIDQAQNGAIEFLKNLEQQLPYSIFFGKSKHYTVEERPFVEKVQKENIPHNLAPCIKCQQEMFDVSSRYYYYPFTSCNNCGVQSSFVESYPFCREHTFMRFLTPCKGCQEEMQTSPYRHNHPLSTCVECGVALRMVDKKNERIANQKGEYRKLFEVCANALFKGKTILVKTLYGYQLFSLDLTHFASTPLAMICSLDCIDENFSMIQDEFHALLSCERPILRVAIKNPLLLEKIGQTLEIKYPNDGITLLLAKELSMLGVGMVYCEHVSSQSEADYLVEFDLPTIPPTQSRLFVHQNLKAIISGDSISFPVLHQGSNQDRAIVNSPYVAIPTSGGHLIDNIERFQESSVSSLFVSREDGDDYPSATIFDIPNGTMMSQIANYLNEKIVGVYFGENIEFFYYNATQLIAVVPSVEFLQHGFSSRLSTLREGSSKLVVNYEKAFGDKLSKLEQRKETLGVFGVVAFLLDLEKFSLEALWLEALNFLAKGGVQIDTHIKNNRFNADAFIASIMSYQLAGVEKELLCYSIFESLGEYICEIANQLCDKSGAKKVALCGASMANPILFGKLKKGLSQREILFGEFYPLGKESATHGALYL